MNSIEETFRVRDLLLYEFVSLDLSASPSGFPILNLLSDFVFRKLLTNWLLRVASELHANRVI